MDLTPQRVREVQFHGRVRGYSPAEVDAFLADVANGLDILLSRLHSLEAAVAARDLDSTHGGGVGEETLARAFVLAQRAADLALAEAEEAAIAVRDEARADATRIINEAEARAVAVTRSARATAQAAISDLNQQREALEQLVRLLRARASRYREGLKDLLAGHFTSVDEWLGEHPDGDDDLGLLSHRPDTDGGFGFVPPGEQNVDLTDAELDGPGYGQEVTAAEFR
jgi:DivIVA domain-containing protein